MNELQPKNPNRPWKAELGDILNETGVHVTSEEYAYTLFRIKKLYNKAESEQDKEISKKLFGDVKERVLKLIEIDVGEAQTKRDKEKVNNLIELAEKVKGWDL